MNQATTRYGQPLVSVIIPCFNCEKFVGEAIRSALAQTYARTEIIVVDDGSSDSSPLVLDSFSQRIQLHRATHQGGAAARNLGLAQATGDYIQFLDADDLLDPNRLERMVQQIPGDSSTVPYSDGRWIDIDGRTLESFNRDCTGVDPIEFVLDGLLPVLAPLYQRALLERIGGFREDLIAAQERDLNLRLACAGATFARVPESLFAIRRLQESVSSDPSRPLSQRLKYIPDACEQLRARGQLTQARALAFARLLARDARVCLQRGQHDLGRRLLAAAKKMDAGGGLDQILSRRGRLAYALFGPRFGESLIQWTRRRRRGRK